MNETLQFAQPLWIWIGLAICVALGLGMVRWNRRRDSDLEKLAHSRLLKQLTESVSRKRRVLKQTLWLVALFLVFVAAARPQYGFEYREMKRRGIDLVFAIDTSRSMLAEDVVPDRLERARLAVTDFVQKLEGDRVALIPFAGNAFSLCPLTLDYSAFFQSLDALDTEIIPHQGTDLATAVREANRLFDEEGNNHRILILITDGEDLQGSVMDAVATAKEKGMTIHTVGVGDPAGALIPIAQPDGSQDFVRDENGEPVRTALDEETLREIAQATGGLYAPLGGAGQGLETIYREKLRLVPKSEFDQRLDQIPLERFEWPLAVAIALLFLEFLLSERKRHRRRKAPVISVARRKAATAAVLGVLLVVGRNAVAQELPEIENETAPLQKNFDDPRAAYNTGTTAFREGDFARAEETLSQTLGNTDDLSLQQRSYYNLGNTRYRIGQQTVEEKPDATIKKWEEAVKSFDDALALNPDDEDARHNRDFVQEKLDELKRQQEEKQEQRNPEEQQSEDDQQQQDQENQQQSSEDQQQSEKREQEQPSEDQSGSGEEQASEEQEPSEGESGEQEQEEEQSDSESGTEEEQESEDSKSGDQESEEQEGEEQSDEAQPTGGEPSEQEPQPGAGEEEEENSEKEPEEAEQPSPQQSGEPQEAQEESQTGAPGSFPEERREPGEMSREEAAQLLEALEKDEQSVIPLPDIQTYRRSVPNNTTRGKTW